MSRKFLVSQDFFVYFIQNQLFIVQGSLGRNILYSSDLNSNSCLAGGRSVPVFVIGLFFYPEHNDGVASCNFIFEIVNNHDAYEVTTTDDIVMLIWFQLSVYDLCQD